MIHYALWHSGIVSLRTLAKILVQFQSKFNPGPVQFLSRFTPVFVQIQSSFSPVLVQFQSNFNPVSV